METSIMETYDFRKNRQFHFSAEEIAADKVLSFVAKKVGVTDGAIEVKAKNREQAFKMFFGVEPCDSIELPEDICPYMDETPVGYCGSGYEILAESAW
jgi:hypothetical protein